MEDKSKVDQILSEIEGLDLSASLGNEIEEADQRREERVRQFRLNIDMDDDETPEKTPIPPPRDPVPMITEPDDAKTADAYTIDPPKPIRESPQKFGPEKKQKKKKSPVATFVKALIYTVIVLALAGSLAYGVIIFLIDSTGFNKSDKNVGIEVPVGATTESIANLLEENDIIDYPLLFRVYSRLSHADGTYQFGNFNLSADMGYSGVIECLQTATPRESVTVTVPEGFTVVEMAALMEEKNICKKDDFINAVTRGEFDFDFVKAIPTAKDGEQYVGRYYRLEGYLFPDTYQLYEDSTGEDVVKKMLQTFSDKVLTAEHRTEINAKGWTIDQAVIIGSIIQGEASNVVDMKKVSRVIQNRLQPGSGFPKLEMDSTYDYIKKILPSIDDSQETAGAAYNTYLRQGLPVGAINNPGADAMDAALHPSDDEKIAKCYFFATDYNTGITYFSETYSQHVAICRRYRIGIYG